MGAELQVVEVVPACPACGEEVPEAGACPSCGAVWCVNCELVAEPGADNCGTCGRWLKRNTGALVHGARRLLSGAGSPLDRARQREVRDAVLRDLGGREAVSAVMAELVEDFSFTVTVLRAARRFMEVKGPMREHGGERPVLGIYERFSRRAERLARRIGTEKGRAAEAAARSHLTPLERLGREPEADR